MVTEWLMSLAASVVGWLFSLVPLPDVPEWVELAGGYIATAVGYLADLSPWIPWPVVIGVLGTFALVLVVSIGIKLARIAWSFVPFIGGDAS